MPSTGRGGAGNILHDADIKTLNQRASRDLEANRQHAEDYTLERDSRAPTSTEEQYKTMGRGGAGNWYSPSALEQTGTFSSTNGLPRADSHAEVLSSQGDPSVTPAALQSNSRSHQANAESTLHTRTDSSSKVPPSHFPAYVGRGGAGNYTGIGMSGAKDPMEREFELQQMKVTQGVEQDVERGLSKPPAAHLGEGKELAGKVGVGRVSGN